MARTTQIDIEVAIEFYYEKLFLCTEDIKKIFGLKSDTTARRKKNLVTKWMQENGKVRLDVYTVDTRIAYEVWGIDISDLESRYNNLLKFRTKKNKMNGVV